MAQPFTKEPGDCMPYSSLTLKSEFSKFGTIPNSMRKELYFSGLVQAGFFQCTFVHSCFPPKIQFLYYLLS